MPRGLQGPGRRQTLNALEVTRAGSVMKRRRGFSGSRRRLEGCGPSHEAGGIVASGSDREADLQRRFGHSGVSDREMRRAVRNGVPDGIRNACWRRGLSGVSCVLALSSVVALSPPKKPLTVGLVSALCLVPERGCRSSVRNIKVSLAPYFIRRVLAGRIAGSQRQRGRWSGMR